jgi:hypothetical protein
MKYTVKSTQYEITTRRKSGNYIRRVFANLHSIVLSDPFTIKIHSVAGDLSLQSDDFIGETIDTEISNPQEIEIVEMDMFSFASEHGCSAVYAIWQFGQEITQ